MTEPLTLHFNEHAQRFDAIYSGSGGVLQRAWDRLTRENVVWRFHATLAAVADAHGKRVLDVGCGPGRYCVAFALRGAHATGIDFAPRMVEQARELAAATAVSDRCDFVATDVFAFHPAEAFDVVVANGLFDYIADAPALFRHLRTLTAGTLIATFPLYTALRVPFRKLWRLSRGCYVRFYTMRAILDGCRAAGFRVETLQRHGPIALLIAKADGDPRRAPAARGCAGR